MWRSQPQTFSYHFETDEALYLIEGDVDVSYPDGTMVELHAGDSVSFAKGHDTIWNVRTPSKKLFVAG
ncbi:cupin domain-containing protein [Gordonia polyisoprenivorans]|uniref:cupin domain-containing protein n=1 Tax=Gordonia polyisoprenivorans TaxID=84595 RepID=UPI003B75BF65